MSKLLATLGISLILASTAASAAAPAAKSPGKPGNSAAAQKYCFKFEGGTGTRISTTECRTKAEWRRLGVDVDNLSSN